MGRVLDGLAASPGSAAGRIRLLGLAAGGEAVTVAADRRHDEERVALEALDAAADEIVGIAARLRELGRADEAEIVETGALLARDPGLQGAVSGLVLDHGRPADAAILGAAEAHAKVIGDLDDPRLAERADDIRSVGRRAARLLRSDPGSEGDPDGNGSAQILVAPDLGPADVAQLEPGVAGIALAAGGVSAHAAIVARSLGIPMVVGAGEELLTVAPGQQLVVDGTAGAVVLGPDERTIEAAEREIAARAKRRERSRATRDLPAVTLDGHPVRVLANAAATPELNAALDAGADGVGLLRTELAFLESRDWPSEEEHRRHLAPILGALPGRVATVRVLDFGGDKTPPFLRGTRQRGIALLLEHPDALEAQLRAILAVAGKAELRILLPMVESVEQVDLCWRALLRAIDEVPGSSNTSVGAMIETSTGVDAAERIARNVDFLSIGTNDLTHSVLGRDRFSTQVALPHHPRVLRSIAAVAQAARGAGVPLEVCGEAASSPIGAPLLIGAGVDELSVGAARVGAVRGWVRSLGYSELRRLEVTARRLETSAQVEALLDDLSRRLDLLERADAGDEAIEGAVGVVPGRP